MRSDARKRLHAVPDHCCDAAAKVARVEALVAEWERTADECELLSHIRAGLPDERQLATAGMVNRTRAENLRAALDGPTDGGGVA